MATKNSVNNKTGSLTLDPGASGDPFVQLSINADDKFIYGVDDSDSDKFKIADANSLATANVFVMTADGERTMPLQPSFLAYLGTTDSNVTGNSDQFFIGSGNAMTEVFDQGGNFNTNGTFTAPVTGLYRLFYGLRLTGITVSHDLAFNGLNTSNNTYPGFLMDPGSAFPSSGTMVITTKVIADMDAADTATISVTVSNGAKVVDVSASGRDVFFGGYLIC